MNAPTEAELDPVLVELFAIRNFTCRTSAPPAPNAAPQTAEQAAKHIAQREAEWRALAPDARESNRDNAARMLSQLLVDGVTVRPTKAAVEALHGAITNPATLAYTMPVRPKPAATAPA